MSATSHPKLIGVGCATSTTPSCMSQGSLTNMRPPSQDEGRAHDQQCSSDGKSYSGIAHQDADQDVDKKCGPPKQTPIILAS